VVKAQKIEPGTTDLQMHYPRLGFLRFQTELSQQRPQPRQGGLGLLARSAHHQRVVGETDQHSMLAHAPSPVNPMQVHVTQQRADHAPNAMGNFVFEVTLGYRRLELPRRGEQQS
jgi:hypothetical protein